VPNSRCDVAVVGAGPAGAAAAVTAAWSGASVVLVDAEARPGGQYWRHGPDGAQPAEHLRQWHDLRRRLEQSLASGRLVHLSRTRVWRADALPSGPVRLETIGGEPAGDEPSSVEAGAVVLAPGAYDRVLPFPGWDLPGVLTAGAAQALLKEHGVLAGSRAVVAGTGPFLLSVAAALAEAGTRVLEVDEAGDGLGWARGWRAAAGTPRKIADGARYGALLARHRVPVHLRSAVIAAHGRDRLESVTVARVDSRWRLVPGTEREVSCDVAAVSYGFLARLELALQLGCTTSPGRDGGPAVEIDAVGRTSVPRVLAAGEITGIDGADLALLEGALAGSAAAAVAAGREPAPPHPAVAARRERLAAFATVMHGAHPVVDSWTGWLTDDTLVCRCEEVPVGAVRAAVTELGAADARAVKLLTRAGMGWCQGRVCGPAVATITAQSAGRAPDPYSEVLGSAARPVAVPVPLGVVAAGAATSQEPEAGSWHPGRPDQASSSPDPDPGGSA
jgi:NADPH-dependent 2,4-dienoyl-CoA reductase/sulfur reductase-like enzyme